MIQRKTPKIRIINLGSGSRGNSSIICHGDQTLMIDCGFSRKQTAQRLLSLDVDPQSVCGILITHEHVDHIRGAALFSREAAAPILATQGTLEGGGLATTGARPLACGSRIQHQAFQITPIRISHDTREPCAFLVEVDGMRSLFATDIGTAEG
ncbi:MAG: MBL fold metallo-hydrolase, partial [Candidatus Krumholzibacteria bacterium]|nr:MBL fold metallo-hydrolase [Candidatus Krumholzibacteria bacterium]